MRKTQTVSYTAWPPTDINDRNEGPVGLRLWQWTLIYIILTLINSNIFSALSKKKLLAYPTHPRPPPTTTVQNPHKAIGPYVNHPHITGDRQPALFSEHCHWKYCSSGRLHMSLSLKLALKMKKPQSFNNCYHTPNNPTSHPRKTKSLESAFQVPELHTQINSTYVLHHHYMWRG